jgi:hypothetical protein
LRASVGGDVKRIVSAPGQEIDPGVRRFMEASSANSKSSTSWGLSRPSAPFVQRKCSGCQEEDMVQTKLRLSQPGDRYEREADRVADAVVDGGTVSEVVPGVGAAIARQADEEEAQAADTASPDVDPEDAIVPDESGMPKRASGVSAAPRSAEVAIPHTGGVPLAEGPRRHMEERIGFDFSPVRIHADGEAASAASSLNALAFTVGNRIFFDHGRYEPTTPAGQRLLAHELTHVAQQSEMGQTAAAQTKLVQRACNSGGDCPWQKQPRRVRNDCANSGPLDESNFITDLAVDLSAQTVTSTWSDGHTENYDCSPRPGVTPTDPDVVGVKCGIHHTNKSKDGMAWFTGFQRQGLRIGFHDSQRVGTGIHSHGCVRVCCDDAVTINENTWSGKTTIHVSP